MDRFRSSQPQEDLKLPDASRFIEEATHKNEAYKALIPHPNDAPDRIDFITTLHGRAPNMYQLFGAEVEWQALNDLESMRSNGMDWSDIRPTEYLKLNSTSLGGKRSNQIVEIAKGAQPDGERMGFRDRIAMAFGAKR